MDRPLEGRTALVTGGSRGLGRAIALRLAELGCAVGVTGRDETALEDTRRAVSAAGGRGFLVVGELSSPEGARAAGEGALAEAGTIDVLVNNAGVVTSAPLLEMSPDAFDAIQAVNVRAALILAQVLVPQMIARGGGKVVNVSSLGAFVGTPGLGAYAASKAALNQLTRTMAVEWGPSNVQANAVCPTVVLTDMGHQVWDAPERAAERRQKESRIPARRFGQPNDVAETVAFFCGPGSDFVNGVAVPVDGGLLVAP